LVQNDHRQLQGLYEELYVRKGGLGEGVLKVEVEQLKEDNARLLKMLKGTKEYQEFADFVDDSGGQVKGIKPASISLVNNVDLESEQWMPQEAFTLAHNFRDRHGNDLTPQLINQLLSDLNRIWRDREKK
jgi:hypothetical protein